MNGTEDHILPYKGGQMKSDRGEIYSAQETIQYWINRNQTDTTPLIGDFDNTNTTDNCTITKHST